MVPDSASLLPVSEGGVYERHAASRLVGFFPFSVTRRGHYVPITVISSGKSESLEFCKGRPVQRFSRSANMASVSLTSMPPSSATWRNADAAATTSDAEMVIWRQPSFWLRVAIEVP
jgi:hypothetical protein